MYSQDLCKKLYILTEVFVRYRYSPDVTHCVFFFSLTIVPFWDRIFKACLHLQFQHECTKYAYILVQQGEVYTTGGLVLKFILFCSPEVYRVVLPQSIALNTLRGKRFVVHVKIITGEWISNWLTEIITALASVANASAGFRSPLNDWIVYINTKTKKLLQKPYRKR